MPLKLAKIKTWTIQKQNASILGTCPFLVISARTNEWIFSILQLFDFLAGASIIEFVLPNMYWIG